MDKAPLTNSVPRLDISTCTPRDFEERFLRRNEPCVLTNVGQGWRACGEWRVGSRAALEHLAAQFAEEEVSVHDCASTVGGRFRISEMHLKDLFALWSRGLGASLYLKDWNLALSDPSFYETPAHFAPDWLNGHAHSTGQASDHRFVYIGRGGTYTPLHKDVLCSFSWSFNVVGTKRWWLVPPDDEWRLHACGGSGPLAHDLRAVDAQTYPDWDAGARARVLHVLQHQDEALFVPSGWVHQVLNEGDACEQTVISINHNWLNAFCAQRCWDFLQQQRAEIVRTVDGCADDEETTQEILEFKFSFNFHSWRELLGSALRTAVERTEAALLELADAATCSTRAESETLVASVARRRANVRSASEEMQVALGMLESVSRTAAVSEQRRAREELLDGGHDGANVGDDDESALCARVRKLVEACAEARHERRSRAGQQGGGGGGGGGVHRA